jgi:exopolyphosphatase/guanosine-5'-triphosphate,3'-diphosphate pyrophosphatase
VSIRGSNSEAVAVVDIGSNSIKVLVAALAVDGSVQALKYRTIDARISAGLSQAAPRLSEEGMVRGLDAIKALLSDVASFSPRQIILVATSAVRGAQNGNEFRERVRAATGHDVRILSGDEEANLIGRGLTCDPALASLRDFYVFDLGGGSLECLAFRDRRIVQVASLPLGCVRLTEKFVADTAGTGGTLTTVRTILAAGAGKTLEQTGTRVTLTDLRSLLGRLGAMPLAQRKQIDGLPPARADVFPTALATVIGLAEIGGFDAFRNSLYNLRFGLAAEALGAT